MVMPPERPHERHEGHAGRKRPAEREQEAQAESPFEWGWEEPSKGLDVTMAVRFDQQTANALRRIARKKGIGPTTLIRMWILERLVQEIESESTKEGL